MVLAELNTFSGICNREAREFDKTYLAQVQRFQGTISGKFDEIMEEFESKLGSNEDG